MGANRSFCRMESPIGTLFIVQENGKIAAIYLSEEDFYQSEKAINMKENEDHSVLKSAKQQLEEYFFRKRKEFDLPLLEEGTDFQLAVWNELKAIPYGETRSYKDIAISIGKEKAVRAVGQANKANKIPIIIPCHRVIGKNKELTGYAGNQIDLKEKLLILEEAEFIH